MRAQPRSHQTEGQLKQVRNHWYKQLEEACKDAAMKANEGKNFSFRTPSVNIWVKHPEKKTQWTNETREQAIDRYCRTLAELPSNRKIGWTDRVCAALNRTTHPWQASYMRAPFAWQRQRSGGS